MIRDDFESSYGDALLEHVRDPGEHGLQAAYEHGRRALVGQHSMLDLVAVHLTARRKALEVRGLDGLDDIDAFLREALAAFEIMQRGYLDSQRLAADARQRADLLRGLSETYLRISSSTTLAARMEQVCVQAREFLGAQEARLEFGRRRPPADGQAADEEADEAPGQVMVAELAGNGGRLILRAPPTLRWSELDRTTLEQLAVLISAPIDDARRLDFAERLTHFGAAMAKSVDRRAIVEGVRQATELGATASVTLPDLDAGAAADSDAARVAKGDDPVYVHDCDGEALAVLPIDSGKQRLGSIAFRYDEPQPFDGVQREFLVKVAERVTAALERARTYALERSARREAERASERLRSLQRLATELAGAATQRRVAQVLLREAVGSSSATGGLVATVVNGRRMDVLAASGAVASRVALSSGTTVAEALAGGLRVTGTQAAVITSRLRTELTEAGIGPIELYPIVAGRRAVGVLALSLAGASAPPQTDARDLVGAQVAMAGPALQRAERYDVEHDIAETLQLSILARPSVALPGVRWSVQYRAGSAGLAGGDWYDLFALDDHRLAIAMGDVVGQGVQAAAVMGQLRSAIRAMGVLIGDPGRLVAAADDYVRTTGQGQYSSMTYIVLDTHTGEMHHTVAGHPPPLLRLPDGSTELLMTGRGPLLGVDGERATATRPVERGTLLLLYTDGLVERRGESVDVGLARLQATVAAAPIGLEPEELCSTIAGQMLVPDQAVDDVAIVAVELAG